MPNYDTNPETSCPLLTTTEREEAAFEQLEKLEEHRGRSSKHLFALLITTCLAFALILSTGFAFSFLVFKRNASNPNKTVHEHSTCKIPPLRQEWRSLSQNSKASYIRAVQCLKTLPSALGLNQTLYDDFPWVHKQHGEYSHNAAPFLAWHRYFIHTYEQSLQRECGYEGQLTYWDWTLDWENITTSPVWDLEYGFGGSGNTSMRPAVFDAYCVTDGPFAWLEVPYFEDIYRPHCLLRGFDETLVDFRDALRPEALQELLMIEDYDSFNLGLENGPHIAIPKSIHGDFSLHTAPFGISPALTPRLRLLRLMNTDNVFRSGLLPPPYTAGSHVVALATY